jgi:hypothetical protein
VVRRTVTKLLGDYRVPLTICPFSQEKCRRLRKPAERGREIRQPADRDSILDNFSGFSDTYFVAGDITFESGTRRNDSYLVFS